MLQKTNITTEALWYVSRSLERILVFMHATGKGQVTLHLRGVFIGHVW